MGSVDKSKPELKTYVFAKEIVLWKKITVQTDCWDTAWEMVNKEKTFDDSHTYEETTARPAIDSRFNKRVVIECLTKLDQNCDPDTNGALYSLATLNGR